MSLPDPPAPEPPEPAAALGHVPCPRHPPIHTGSTGWSSCLTSHTLNNNMCVFVNVHVCVYETEQWNGLSQLAKPLKW